MECWSDTDKKCPYCKTTQKLAGYSGVAVEDDSSSDSDNDGGCYTSPVYQIHSEEEGGEVKQTYPYSSYKKIIESFADSSSDDNDDDDIMNLLNGIQRGPTSQDKTSLSVGNSLKSSDSNEGNSLSRSESIVISRSDSVGTTREFVPVSDLKEAGKTSSRRSKAYVGQINSTSVSESIREAAFSLSQYDSNEAATNSLSRPDSRNSLSQPDSNEAARNSLSQSDSNEAARNSLSQPDSNEAARNSLSKSDSNEAARNSLSQSDSNEAARNSLLQSDSIEAARNSVIWTQSQNGETARDPLPQSQSNELLTDFEDSEGRGNIDRPDSEQSFKSINWE